MKYRFCDQYRRLFSNDQTSNGKPKALMMKARSKQRAANRAERLGRGNKEDEMTSNRKFVGIGATALSLALAVATPAFAVGLRGGGAMHVGSGGFRGDQAIVGPVVSRADASYCAQRWAYYDPASGKYMGDDGEWHPCP
jgi:hypothetical protein